MSGYDWNNAETITVPKGLYGWQDEGRVRMDGQVFRFPVGKATSVPQPLAEHLKKLMAMTEEERPESPHRYGASMTFCTDEDGNPMWDDRRHWLELAAICPEVLTDPDVNILYDAEKTEIAYGEFRDNLDIGVAYFPNVTQIDAFAFSGCTNLRAAIFLKDVSFGGGNAFYKCTSLEYIYFPATTRIYNGNFSGCTSLKELYLPKAVSVDAFDGCTNLTKVTLPAALSVGRFSNCANLTEINAPVSIAFNDYCFANCTSLTKLYLSNANGDTIRFYDEVFKGCSNLTALILPDEKVAIYDRVRTSLFTGTPIADGTGYIYVPAALVESYKTAAANMYGTSWADHADQFRAIEDWPEICGEDVDEYITKGEAAKLVGEKTAGMVKSVNGIAPDDAGNVEVEIPEGFSGSWNDLTDKPFEQIATTATMNMLQDLGQTDYTHNGYTLYFRDDRPLYEYGSWTSQGYNVSLTEGDDVSLYSSNAGTSFKGTVMKAEVPSTGLEFLYFGNLGLVNEIMAETFDGHNFDDTGERHLLIMFDGPTWVVASTYGMKAQQNRWSFPVRKIVTLEDKYIPNSIARTTDIPTVPVAAAVADAAGDTPTAAEFNALLSALRTAGLLAT